MLKQIYNQNEAEEILRKAIRRSVEKETAQAMASSDEVSTDQILLMAAELGMTPETIESVLREHEAERLLLQAKASEQEERNAFIKMRKEDFYQHLWLYMGINAIITVMGIVNLWGFSGKHLYFSFLVWGIGIVFHAVSSHAKGGEDFEKEFVAWRRKKNKKPRRTTRKLSKQQIVHESET